MLLSTIIPSLSMHFTGSINLLFSGAGASAGQMVRKQHRLLHFI
jgi:hypothetical protein